jgi:hypothetical protein
MRCLVLPHGGDQGIRAYTEGSDNKEEDSSKSELHDDAEVWI